MIRLLFVLSLFYLPYFGKVEAQLQVPQVKAIALLDDLQASSSLLTPPPPSLRSAFMSQSLLYASQPVATSMMYRQHLAFFCRVEVKIDKAVKMPFRFRLGSVDYVDYLEGKRDSY